jgi:hypothetical protein
VRACAAVALSVLKLDGWAPVGARLDCLELEARWWSAPLASLAAAADVDAVVVFGPPIRGDEAVIARFAWNAADPSFADVEGMHWPGFELVPFADPIAPATLSPHAMARAVEISGLPCDVDDDPPADIANRVLYNLLRPGRAPPAALVRLPQPIEENRTSQSRGRVNRMQIVRGVQGALGFAAAAAEAACAQARPLPIVAEAD